MTTNFEFEKYGIDVSVVSRRAKNVKTFCPQCRSRRSNKRDKSLSVNMQTGEFNCHYCGFKGCAAVPDPQEKEEWMKRQPWYRPARIQQKRKDFKRPAPKPHAPMSEKALAWFAERGISQATLEALKVTEGMEWMPQKNGQANTIQFNFYLDGQLINTKFRTGDKCFKLCSGAELIPYNIDAIKGQKECIITEGEMDALSFHEIGLTAVVSVPNGANANLDYLDNFIEEYFEDKDTIYIAVDTDAKGVLLRDELVRRFGAERCRVLDFGDDCKDANEHLMAHGRESLRHCLESAPEIKVEGVFTVTDFEQSLDAIYKYGLQRGVTIGHENVDNLISFETKRLCMVTGYPGSGKSEFIDEMAERINMRYGWRFAYFSPENAPLEYHASKLIEKFSGKKFDQEHLPEREYLQVKEHLDSNFFFIAPSDYRLDTILEKAKYLVRRKGIKALVIDPYNRLEDERGGERETDYISKILDRLTRFAQQHDILIILMAHPTKPARKKDGQTDPPTLYDISGSAHFFNKTDFGIVVHRNNPNNTVEIRIEKVKFRHLGQAGVAEMKYNLENGRYVPYYREQQPQWDNTNHLAEAARRRAAEAAEAAQLDFDEWSTLPDEEIPF